MAACLAILPRYEFRQHARQIKILLAPALLGSHSTLAETNRALGVDKWDVHKATEPIGHTLDQFGSPADGDWALPLALLPDPWLEYTFYLNTAEGAEERLVPLFEWKAPRIGGGLGMLNDTPQTPLGFEVALLAPTLLDAAPEARWLVAEEGSRAAVVDFTLRMPTHVFVRAFGRDGVLAAQPANPETRLWLMVRRRSLSTDFLALKLWEA